MENKTTIGFIGLGAMGEAMAANLLAADFSVRVYNRSAEKTIPLQQQGANVAATPREVAEGADIVITMLSNDAVLEAVTLGDDGVLAGLKPGAVHLSMSTVSPATSRRLAAQHADKGAHYVASPVFGRPEMAAAKKLWICVSGNAGAIETARPALTAMSQGLFTFGDDAGAANIVKLSGNFMIASCVETMAEVATLAEKGIEPVAGALDANTQVVPLALDVGQGETHYKLGHDNFYVITRYNHSHLYAMAITTLAERIRNAMEDQA